MSRLPAITALEAIRAFERAEFVVERQSASHVIMPKAGHPLLVTIPSHRGNVKRGTVRRAISDAGLTVKEFIAFHKS